MKLKDTPGRRFMTNLDSISKRRDITSLTKICIVKAMVFLVLMYRCESWNINKLSTKEWILSNGDAGEDSRESLELQGDKTSQS